MRTRCEEKNTASSAGWRGRVERPAFGALCAFLLAPIIAQGLWRPLSHYVAPSGTASTVTICALAVTATIVLAQVLRPRQRPLHAAVLGGLVATGASVGWSLGVPGLLTLLLVATALAFLVPWLSARLPTTLDGLARRHTLLFALYVALALFAVVKTAQLSIFIGDPARPDLQALPGNSFTQTHSCLTAYVRAADLSRQGVENLYEDAFWHGSLGLPPLPPGVENPYHPFHLDNFSYPPPFLLLTAPLSPFAADFLAQRALWFGLNGVLLALGLWLVARFVDGPAAHRVLLLAPLLFGSLPILITLQIGNFQTATVVLSIVAMVALHRGRAVSGGALLALTILSKVSPGILGVVLLAQRRVRSAAITAGFGVLLFALSVLRCGTKPVQAFLTYALPRLSSGRAFPFMETEAGILTNMSPFGIPFKLQLLGLDIGDPWHVARRVAQVYTLGLVGLAIAAARRRGDLRDQAITWMALLVLAALQSPFAPGYVLIGLLWATTLLAVEVRSARQGIGLTLIWFFLLVVLPGLQPTTVAIQSMGQTAVILAFAVWLIVRRPRSPAPLADSCSAFRVMSRRSAVERPNISP